MFVIYFSYYYVLYYFFSVSHGQGNRRTEPWHYFPLTFFYRILNSISLFCDWIVICNCRQRCMSLIRTTTRRFPPHVPRTTWWSAELACSSDLRLFLLVTSNGKDGCWARPRLRQLHSTGADPLWLDYVDSPPVPVRVYYLDWQIWAAWDLGLDRHTSISCCA